MNEELKKSQRKLDRKGGQKMGGVVYEDDCGYERSEEGNLSFAMHLMLRELLFCIDLLITVGNRDKNTIISSVNPLHSIYIFQSYP